MTSTATTVASVSNLQELGCLTRVRDGVNHFTTAQENPLLMTAAIWNLNELFFDSKSCYFDKNNCLHYFHYFDFDTFYNSDLAVSYNQSFQFPQLSLGPSVVRSDHHRSSCWTCW